MSTALLEGTFSLTIGEETRSLGPGQGYFIPAGIPHGWSAQAGPVKIVDVSAKAPAAVQEKKERGQAHATG